MKKLIYGVGINDANYRVQEFKTSTIDGVKKKRLLSHCPIYRKWVGVLARTCDEKTKMKSPHYADSKICDEWLTFSNFSRWVGDLDISNLELDKDILFKGNKLYSPKTCAFIPKCINLILATNPSYRTELPLGVVGIENCRFEARLKIRGKVKIIGYYDNAELAHKAWQIEKSKYIIEMICWWKTQASYNKEVSDSLLIRAEQLIFDSENDKETKEL